MWIGQGFDFDGDGDNDFFVGRRVQQRPMTRQELREWQAFGNFLAALIKLALWLCLAALVSGLLISGYQSGFFTWLLNKLFWAFWGCLLIFGFGLLAFVALDRFSGGDRK